MTTETKPRWIIHPYFRVLAQLLMEIEHATYNSGYEAQRRASYAHRVLNEFGRELSGEAQLADPGPKAESWRSKVLTPIVQRQLWGVPDCYGPSVDAGVLALARGSGLGGEADKYEGQKVTISHATRFYLGYNIGREYLYPVFRRNILYLRETRWFTAIVFQTASVSDVGFYDLTLKNQDKLMGPRPDISMGCKHSVPELPPFSPTEIEVIESEGLGDLYMYDLEYLVSRFLSLLCPC